MTARHAHNLQAPDEVVGPSAVCPSPENAVVAEARFSMSVPASRQPSEVTLLASHGILER